MFTTDVTFNAIMMPIIIISSQLFIYSPKTLLAIVMMSYLIVIVHGLPTFHMFLKITALLPLGLASVLFFYSIPRRITWKLDPAFTSYGNIAVFTNIGMMVFTPYHNTIRGLCSKVTCMALFVWIVQQGYKVGWRTTTHNELGMFLYHAVSNEWILTHAVYRFVLVTLATFSRRIRYLEFYTAIIVLILHRRVNSLPMRYLF
ncbi:hypothetical protein ROZALSC1DRAFT_14951, partial [Rozella allomycis CSF55]